MAMRAALTKAQFDELDEGLKSEYKEKTDGPFKGYYFLDVTHVELKNDEENKKATFALEDVSGLRSALEKERENNRTKDSKLKSFEDLDPDEARRAIARLKEIGENAPDSEKHQQAMDALKKQLGDKHAKELADAVKTSEDLEAQIRQLLVDQAANQALNKHKLVEGGVDLLLPHIKGSIKVEKDDNGKFRARVVGSDGQERVSPKQGSTDPMTVEELIDEMSKKTPYTYAFAASGASGSDGADGKSGGGNNGQQGNQNQPGPSHKVGTTSGNGQDDDQQSLNRGIHRQNMRPETRLAQAREKEASQNQR